MINKLEYQNIERLIIVNIKNTKTNLKIAVAWFTNPNLFTVIIHLLEKGVEVDLILSNDDMNFINSKINFNKFIASNGNLFVNASPNLMHNKFCIIDNKYLINGSYNWTLKAEKINFENVVLTDNLNLVNDFIVYFDYLKSKTTLVSTINTLKTISSISEKETELELLSNVDIIRNEDINQSEDIVPQDNQEYTEELLAVLEEADLLYLNSKHDKCITFCRTQLKIFPKIPELYCRISEAYWRLKNPKDQIKFAQKAIDIDNECYDAYNLLGMGYSILGKEQLSILNFSNCILNQPDEYVYLRNRSVSYNDLRNIPNLTPTIRVNYKKKEQDDLKRVIEIIDNFDDDKLTYNEFYTKSFANSNLGNIKKAKEYIEIALSTYNNVKDKFPKDKNILNDMKELQRDINLRNK